MPSGRPSSYSEEIASEILSAIATTRVGLTTVCEDERFPEPRTVYRWLMENEAFCQRYARAKEDSLQILEDEMLELADNTRLGEIVTVKGDGTEERKIADMIEHRKLQIETRKWLMGKLKPKKYGDRTVLAGDKDNPLGVQLIHSVPQPDRGEK
jgi:hypothetical protein